MDSNLAAILLGLLTNALSAFLAQMGRRDSKLIIGERLQNTIKWEQTALQPILQRATTTVAEHIEWQGSPSFEVVCLFLSSPEAEAIIRQVYATQLIGSENRTHMASIKQEFLISLHLFTTSYADYANVEKNQLKEIVKYGKKIDKIPV